ncbi:MAG: hypothetical protein BJ554DRAFT_3789, partial [Olpidium bornovanus]
SLSDPRDALPSARRVQLLLGRFQLISDETLPVVSFHGVKSHGLENLPGLCVCRPAGGAAARGVPLLSFFFFFSHVPPPLFAIFVSLFAIIFACVPQTKIPPPQKKAHPFRPAGRGAGGCYIRYSENARGESKSAVFRLEKVNRGVRAPPPSFRPFANAVCPLADSVRAGGPVETRILGGGLPPVLRSTAQKKKEKKYEVTSSIHPAASSFPCARKRGAGAWK